MGFVPRPQEVYRHFKGNLYQITAIAEHTETGETLVIYQALYGDFKIYARPLAMFVSPVDHAKYPDVKQQFRFELQGPDAERQIRESGVDVGQPSEETCDRKEEGPDPMVVEFLDASTYEERLNILTGLHHRITDEMLTTMSIVCDIELGDGDVESRYDELRSCLLTLEKYECNRLRS